jgi:o-succinylbenzoate synthase
MQFKFKYTPYSHPLKQPLLTSHGLWTVREGLIITIEDDRGNRSRGEIAPIPWFGSETIEDAIDWCDRVGDEISEAAIFEIPNTLPACQFGCGGAWMVLTGDLPRLAGAGVGDLDLCGLLPTGAAALDSLQDLAARGYRTLKWKIGVADGAIERSIADRLLDALPAGYKLRLDANGGLDIDGANEWLTWAAKREAIEFIEQPLSIDCLADTIALARLYSTPIALDESISTYDRLLDLITLGWQGIYTVKPSIAGFPWRLMEITEAHSIDLVLSSSIETAIGREICLRLAAKLGTCRRALGFGIEGWLV